MAKSKRNELAAGIFVIAALAAGFAVLVWLGTTKIFEPAKCKAVFYAPAGAGASGLQVGSGVLVNDAWVGKITRIWFDSARNRTMYEAELDTPGVEVHCDGTAIASAAFVGGTKLVVIDLGSSEAPPASEAKPVEIHVVGMAQAMAELTEVGRRLNQQLDPEDEKALISRLQKLVGELTATAREMHAQLNPEDSKSLIASVLRTAGSLEAAAANVKTQTDPTVDGATVTSIQAAAADLRAVAASLRKETDAKAAGSLLAKVHTSADNVVQATGDAAGMVANIRPNAEKTVAMVAGYTEKDLGQILQRFTGVVDTMQETVDQFKQIAGTSRDIIVLNRPRIDDALCNLDLMSQNLKAMSAEIRRNPWRLLQKPTSKETRDQNIYDSVRAFSEGAAQLDDAIARLAALRQARPEGVRGNDPRLLEINRHLQQAFARFKYVEQCLLQNVQKK